MRVRQRRLVLVVALLVGGTAAAQQPHPADTLVVIHGKVRDAATREPISGAVASTIDSHPSRPTHRASSVFQLTPVV